MAAPVIQFKRGAFTNLPGLQAGEPALTTDTYDFYVGIDSTTNNNKFFGSHRYWTKETSSTGSSVRLVEGTNNGTNYVALKAPNSLTADLTYTLPGLQGASSSVLTNDGSGNLSWASGSNNATFTGITTFSDTTDSSTSTDGAVRIAGGLGVAKSLNVGSNFSVAGVSTFVGNVTFQGGTINLGDSNTDNVVFAADVNSNIIPNTDNTYDFGNSAQRWRNASFSGIVTAPTIDASGGTVTIGTLQVNGNSNFNGNVTIGGTAVSIAASTLSVADRDIILGYTQFPTDTTANHGGIAIASTEGTPLIPMGVSGINTLPNTYKQLMWVKSGTFSGLGTDAFIFNYGVGIGSTQFGAGVRLAVGGVQVTDNTVTATTGSFTNLTGTLTGTISTATRATVVDTTATSTAASYYIPFVANSTSTTSETIRVDADLSYNPSTNKLTVGGDLQVSGNNIQSSSATALTLSGADVTVAGDLTVGGNDIKASDGTTALTLTNSTGAVTAASDLTVTGNLYVSGNTTQVNTAALTVEDRTIDLGVVNGSVPSSTTTWDLGVLFNYHSGGSAKKSAVVWEHGDTRFKFASLIGSDTNGTDNNTPQLTVTTFAPIEIGALWVNDCAGSSQVISCTGSTRNLENITIDAGTF